MARDVPLGNRTQPRPAAVKSGAKQRVRGCRRRRLAKAAPADRAASNAAEGSGAVLTIVASSQRQQILRLGTRNGMPRILLVKLLVKRDRATVVFNG